MMFEIGSTANSFLSPFWSDKAENGATANGVDLTGTCGWHTVPTRCHHSSLPGTCVRTRTDCSDVEHDFRSELLPVQRVTDDASVQRGREVAASTDNGEGIGGAGPVVRRRVQPQRAARAATEQSHGARVPTTVTRSPPGCVLYGGAMGVACVCFVLCTTGDIDQQRFKLEAFVHDPP